MPKEKKNNLNNLIDKYKNLNVVSEIQNNLASIKPTVIDTNKINLDDLYNKDLYNLNNYVNLTTSIKNDGILTPVIINNININPTLIDGIKRYLIALKYNIKSVPCYFISIDEDKKNQYILINLLNKNENVLIKSYCLNVLINKYKFSVEKIKEITSVSISNIKNILRLNNLPSYIKEDLLNNILSYGHARSLLNLSEDKQKELYDQKKNNLVSVREVEHLKHKYIGSRRKSKLEIKNNKIIIEFVDCEEAKKNFEKLKKRYSNS